MAYDFPNSPTVGQIYTPAGGPAWQWNGTAWLVQGAVGQTYAGMYVGDTPPGSPTAGMLWYESDTGNTFVWFDDGNSQQWVQTNFPPTPFPLPPNDDAEYVLRNGGWRQKSASKSLVGVAIGTGVTFAVPDNVRAMRFVIEAGTATAIAFGMNLRVSADGTTFLSGATDYTHAGLYSAVNTSNNWTTQAAASAAQALLGVSNNLGSGYLWKCEGQMQLAKVNTGSDYCGSAHVNAHQSTQYESLWNWWMASAASDNVLAWKGVQFAAFGVSGNFSEGQIEVNWIY